MDVLIAVDVEKGGRGLVDGAVALLRNALGKVWLLHVAEPEPDFVGFAADPAVMREQLALQFRREHRELQAMAEALRRQGVDATALLVQGGTAEAVAGQAAKLGADLIVVGGHKAGWLGRFLPGGLEAGELAAAGRPVLVMPAG